MEFNIFLLLGVWVIICSQCNFSSVNALIGPHVRMANDREFPFIVALKRLNTANPLPIRDHICTAALISRIHVLSAAQCVYHRHFNETLVLYGTNVLIYGVGYTIHWWITYNEWSLHRHRALYHVDHDVAVIKLTHEIEGDFEPATVLSASNGDLMGRIIQLAGWGVTDRGVLSLNLLTDVALIVGNNQCESHIHHVSGNMLVIDDQHFCTIGRPLTLIQRGDFGGPVLYMNKIVGINKKALPEMNRNHNHLKINVHTNINFYYPFILDVTTPNFVWP